MFSTLESYPVSTQLSQSHFDSSHCWVHGSSHSQQQFLPPENPCMPLPSLLRNQVDSVLSKAEAECTQKRFLVFDQSGDQTILLFTSDIHKSFQSLKQPACRDRKEELQRSYKDLAVWQGTPGNTEPDLHSEKQEDTEEINALLYSEDESDYCSKEDEVTSSCHPSSSVSAHVDQEKHVASDGHSHGKRRKVLESYDSVTGPFLKTSNESVLEVESSCGSCRNTWNGFRKRSKPSSNKIGEEKIFKTVSLLRSIVPGEELVDPILVIDRAIDYLKTLKMEAKNRGHMTLCLHDT